jgi:hypothetical protein
VVEESEGHTIESTFIFAPEIEMSTNILRANLIPALSLVLTAGVVGIALVVAFAG